MLRWRKATAPLSGATGLRPGRLRRRGSARARSHRGVVGCRRTNGECLMLVAPAGRERFAMATLAIDSGASSKGKRIRNKN